jgi:hypothetical protein
MARDMHPEEVEERKLAFQDYWRHRALPEVMKIRPVYQGVIHALLKSAFYAGTNWERRKHEPTQLGGVD